MKINIVKGNIKYIKDCEDAIVNSALGAKYFSIRGSAKKALLEGFNKGEIYIALDSEDKCIGFIWFILNGIFHSFPYLHIIAVKNENRNNGVGKELLKFFEETCFKDYTKLFLVVADFNPDARKLYEKVGYTQVGTLPNLYRENITEYLMMKVRT